MLHWKWRTFQELTSHELYDILSLRQDVFTHEQQCKELDIDNRDQHCIHLLGILDNKLAAYLRVLPDNIAYPGAVSFGRVATAQFARGQGIGKELINQVLMYLKDIDNSLPVIISAQQYLEKFYQAFNFETISEPYDEAGIPHIKMKLMCALNRE
jgi:ElaA protein